MELLKLIKLLNFVSTYDFRVLAVENRTNIFIKKDRHLNRIDSIPHNMG